MEDNLAQIQPGLTRQEISVLREVCQAIRQIRHGQVQISIQDGRVVQLDRTEKVRFK